MDIARWRGSRSTTPGRSRAHGPGERLPDPSGLGVVTWRTDVVQILYSAWTTDSFTPSPSVPGLGAQSLFVLLGSVHQLAVMAEVSFHL